MSLLKTLCVFGTRPEAIKMALLVLHCLAGRIGDILGLATIIAQLTEQFQGKHHALFFGRDPYYLIAMEGALKLKEISYVHSKAYAASELKLRPLALVEDDMSVVSVASSDSLLEKLKSSLQEVRARGGQLINFPFKRVALDEGEGITHIVMHWVYKVISSMFTPYRYRYSVTTSPSLRLAMWTNRVIWPSRLRWSSDKPDSGAAVNDGFMSL